MSLLNTEANMETLLIDRETRPETILSFMGGGARVKISKQGANIIVVTPIVTEDEPVADDISAIFDGLRVDLTDHKFDRDRANDYE
jgi:hypothetical protein